MSDPQDVVTDLAADADELDTLLTGLTGPQWRLATAAPGWTVTHQVAHLTATFKLAGLAAADPARFRAFAGSLSDDFDANVAAALRPYLASPPRQLLTGWQTERGRTVAALAALPPQQEVPWLVRPLTAAILAAAGIMELFAHGQDIADAVGVTRRYTDRIRHLVEFAVRTWDFGYLARGLTPPSTPFRFELLAPSGAVWGYGPADADQRITGPAVDFCLLATRRRHRADLAVRATGAIADGWLDIAQSYRGSPGPGRSPGQFPASPPGSVNQ